MGEGNEYLVSIMGQAFFMLFPIVIVFALYNQSSFRTTVSKKKSGFYIYLHFNHFQKSSFLCVGPSLCLVIYSFFLKNFISEI